MEPEPEEVIRQELGPGEKLLWAGRPRQGIVLRPADAYLVFVGLFFTAFSVFWVGGVIIAGLANDGSGAGSLCVALFGVPFILVGLYMLVGRFFVEARQRNRTSYGVTSERVIIVSGLFARQVKSLALETITDLSLTERPSGSGYITFGPIPPYYGVTFYYVDTGTTTRVPTFELEAGARAVYETIRAAQRAARSGRDGGATSWT